MFTFNYKYKSHKYLRCSLVSAGGRNFTGQSSLGHRSGPKIHWNYCFVDHSRIRYSSHMVLRYDFNGFRNCYLMLVYDFRRGLGYHQSVSGLRISQTIFDNMFRLCGTGSVVPLKFLSPGQIVSNVSSGNSQICKFGRSFGSKVVIIAFERGYILCKLPSGQTHRFDYNTRGLIGSAAQNFWGDLQSRGRAGFQISRGRRPVVRGVAKNPVDHPHGGGEGKKSPPAARRSPWGWLIL